MVCFLGQIYSVLLNQCWLSMVCLVAVQHYFWTIIQKPAGSEPSIEFYIFAEKNFKL